MATASTIYVCQPAGLPNRLYRNRGDGTFEDITSSGVGLLDNTSCALFADFDNDGRQDLIVVRATGPLLFLNQGGGKFRPSPMRFSSPTLRGEPSPARPPPITIATAGWMSISASTPTTRARTNTTTPFPITPRKTARPISDAQ
jgi:hypothetical protein